MLDKKVSFFLAYPFVSNVLCNCISRGKTTFKLIFLFYQDSRDIPLISPARGIHAPCGVLVEYIVSKL
jgi:hypothetical protein